MLTCGRIELHSSINVSLSFFRPIETIVKPVITSITLCPPSPTSPQMALSINFLTSLELELELFENGVLL